ncbi:NCS2 family permease [Clostridium paraputrificum]|uniref:NCS2 family permease n=1 Tax=Clostridium paraputrificum TaxID=29363 RepID=UPI003D35193E
MEKIFKLKEHGVSVKTEFIAALTSFFAAVYIIIVNASILGDSGIAVEPLIIATVLASLVGCLLAAFLSNTPLIIMPGMGINALFTYTLVNSLGLSFYEALGAVVVAGVLFTVIAVTPMAEIINKAIPVSLKHSITVGLGLFIAFLGLQKSGLVIQDPSTFVGIGDLSDLGILAFLLILIITLFMFLKNIPGGFLLGIVLGTIICVVFNIIDLPNSYFSIPDFESYRNIFFKADFSGIRYMNFWIATFSLTLILLFENIGILHGQVDSMLKSPEKNKKSLISVALSAIACGFLGTSPSVSTIEGSSGITQGGRTGLTALFTGIMFLLSLFMIPFIKLIPNEAIAPVLIIIGCLMIQNLKDLNFDDFSELFPSFLVIILIPLTFSIVNGIAIGFIAYPICKIFSGKYEELSFPIYIISFLFLIYLIL